MFVSGLHSRFTARHYRILFCCPFIYAFSRQKINSRGVLPFSFNSTYQMLTRHWLPGQYQYKRALSCIAALLFWGLSVTKSSGFMVPKGFSKYYTVVLFLQTAPELLPLKDGKLRNKAFQFLCGNVNVLEDEMGNETITSGLRKASAANS